MKVAREGGKGGSIAENGIQPRSFVAVLLNDGSDGFGDLLKREIGWRDAVREALRELNDDVMRVGEQVDGPNFGEVNGGFPMLLEMAKDFRGFCEMLEIFVW